jgi:hypothetical protein
LGIDPATGDPKTNGASKDIYSDYSNLAVEDVAQSTAWYHTYVVYDTFTENLKLTMVSWRIMWQITFGIKYWRVHTFSGQALHRPVVKCLTMVDEPTVFNI